MNIDAKLDADTLGKAKERMLRTMQSVPEMAAEHSDAKIRQRWIKISEFGRKIRWRRR